ncbi:MAG: hypothetical protein JSV79_00205 [Armatimonadota bacterium]|nr:MAG: hypothetical protein JSV79_00205 [Armatimonadota bacterium]
MVRFALTILVFAALASAFSCRRLMADDAVGEGMGWLRAARITTPEGTEDLPAVQRDGVSVVLFHVNGLPDVDVPPGVLYPDLAVLREQYPDLKIVIYIAPLEVQTPGADKDGDGKLDPGQRTFFTEHPESVQVGIGSQPIVSYGQAAFWVEDDAEDVWVTPTSPYVRERAIALVKRIASDGADGIWFDVPRFVMWWARSGPHWASFDRFSLEKFKVETGFEAPREVNWEDPAWKAWVRWRQDTMAEFVSTLREAAQSVSPKLRFGVEHYGGFDWQGPAEAWAATKLRRVTDYLAHEYGSAARSPSRARYYNWLYDNAVYAFYRGVDRDHPTWILSYGASGDAQRLNAATQISHSCCFYENKPPGMSGSADYGARRQIFSYIRSHEELYYHPDLRPARKLGLYFSQQTIDQADLPAQEDVFASEFFGVAMMLLESNLPFQVFTEDSLDSLEGIELLILPGASCIGATQISQLRGFLQAGSKILALGDNATTDESGSPTPKTAKALVAGQLAGPLLGAQYMRLARPGRGWRRERDRTSEDDPEQTRGEPVRQQLLALLQQVNIQQPMQADAPRKVLLLPYCSDDRIIVRATNYSGVGPDRPVPTPISNIALRVSLPAGRRVVGARQIDYPAGAEKPLRAQVSNGVVSTTFDLGTHAVLVFDLAPPA